jgi:hypothetical protein
LLYPFIGLFALGGATCCRSCIRKPVVKQLQPQKAPSPQTAVARPAQPVVKTPVTPASKKPAADSSSKTVAPSKPATPRAAQQPPAIAMQNAQSANPEYSKHLQNIKEIVNNVLQQLNKQVSDKPKLQLIQINISKETIAEKRTNGIHLFSIKNTTYLFFKNTPKSIESLNLSEEEVANWRNTSITVYSLSGIDTHIYITVSKWYYEFLNKDSPLYLIEPTDAPSLDKARGDSLGKYLKTQHCTPPPELLAEIDGALEEIASKPS